MKKVTEMSRLVEERKRCRLCGDLKNPAEVDEGVFDSERIGPYTRWQGNLDARLMVVGRDFAPVERFRALSGWPGESIQTNLSLVRLLAEAGFTIAPPCSGSSDDQIFFTNAVLCLPSGSAMRTRVRQESFRNCGRRFLRRTIEVVQPRAVAALGMAALDTILEAFERPRCAGSLSANMNETVTPWKFRVEGEQGLEADERDGDSLGGTGGGGGGEGEPAAVHSGVQAKDRPGGGWL